MSTHVALVIGKLLRKAETTDSTAEAEALMAKAQSLATRHAIDLALARLAHHDREQREGVEERTVTIGRPRQPHLVLKRRLFAAVAEANDVTVLLRGTEAVLFPIGFPSDLDVVEAMHRSLEVQMVKSGDDWVRSSGTTLHTTQARGLFYEGFVTRIHTRLLEARDHELWGGQQPIAPRRAGVDATNRALSSTALALRAKKREVDDFIKTKYPRVGTRTTRAKPPRDHAGLRAQQAGRSAADRARLSSQKSLE